MDKIHLDSGCENWSYSIILNDSVIEFDTGYESEADALIAAMARKASNVGLKGCDIRLLRVTEVSA